MSDKLSTPKPAPPPPKAADPKPGEPPKPSAVKPADTPKLPVSKLTELPKPVIPKLSELAKSSIALKVSKPSKTPSNPKTANAIKPSVSKLADVHKPATSKPVETPKIPASELRQTPKPSFNARSAVGSKLLSPNSADLRFRPSGLVKPPSATKLSEPPKPSSSPKPADASKPLESAKTSTVNPTVRESDTLATHTRREDITKKPKINNLIIEATKNVGNIKDPNSKTSKQVLYRKASGQFLETLSNKELGGIDTNKISNNFVGYDAVRLNEVAQTKSFITGSLTRSISNYGRALRETLGLRGNKLNEAAKKFLDFQTDPRWKDMKKDFPPQMQNAKSLNQMTKAINDLAVLRIPSEDVGKVQDYIGRTAQSYPSVYGIKAPSGSKAFEREVELLKQRIRPAYKSNLTNRQLKFCAKAIHENKIIQCRGAANTSKH